MSFIKIAKFSPLLVFLLLLLSIAQATSKINITVIADSWVTDDSPSTNYGTSTELSHKHPSSATRTFLAFYKYNLSKLPPGVTANDIVNVQWWTYTSSWENPSNPTIYVYHVFDQTWTESGITRSNNPCGTGDGNPSFDSDCNSTNWGAVAPNTVGWFSWSGATPAIKQELRENSSTVDFVSKMTTGGGNDEDGRIASKEHASNVPSKIEVEFNDPTPADFNVSLINLTSGGGLGQLINLSNPSCSGVSCNVPTTLDSTPTFRVNTTRDGYCRIGASSINYSSMGDSRNCSGGASSIHTCTLTSQDELHEEESSIYINCQTSDNMTYSSGPIKIYLGPSNYETLSREAIEGAARSTLGTYISYNDQRVYLRNSANNQFTARFDKVIKYANKIWAFNVLTGNDTAVGGFNITPTLYILEFRNSTPYAINQTVQQLITQTR